MPLKIFSFGEWNQLMDMLSTLLCCAFIIYCSALGLCVLIACSRPPTLYIFSLLHLYVPIATSTSIAIKHLQQHFQVVLVKRSPVYYT